MDRWYVVQSKPKHEMTVVQNLENQHFTCYLPRFVSTKNWRGKVIESIEPLFPSYLFVRFDVSKDRWRSINGTRGALRLLCATDERVTPLPIGFVEDMLSKADSRGHLTMMKTENILRKFVAGDVLRINQGAFEGFIGTCERIQKDYAVLLLSLLSGKAEVKLPLNTLEYA